MTISKYTTWNKSIKVFYAIYIITKYVLWKGGYNKYYKLTKLYLLLQSAVVVLRMRHVLTVHTGATLAGFQVYCNSCYMFCPTAQSLI